MEKSLFSFIWRYSARQQLVILLITVIAYPVTYALLELPKLIVNDAIEGENFPREVATLEFDQISYLVLLCLTFLGLVVLSNGIKLVLNVYKGRLGERMLRRLRFDLFQRVLRFRLPHFKKVSSGEIIPMITSEVEDVGGFIGEAVALPAYQGGMLVVQIGFIFMQDPLLGLAAISSYPMQAYIIPKLQRKVVLLSRKRVRNVRVIADKIGESIGGVAEIHANDASAWHSADLSDRFYTNYKIRFRIFNWKYFIKFLNNFMNQLTPFLFYLIGGWLVIEGNLSLGALLAVIAAYKDLAGPWKELLAYYQMVADVDVKYQTVVENFDPADIVLYGLRHRPLRPPEREGEAKSEHVRRLAEARATRNPDYDIEAEWEDLDAAGCETADGLDARALELIEATGLAADVFRMGLQSPIDPGRHPEFAERVLAVRRALADRVEGDGRLAAMVELWHIDRFNNSASVAENLLFAAPSDPAVGIDTLAGDADVLAALKETGLYDRLVGIGLKIATTMVELFANVSGDSGLLGDYSFITQDELPEFERITRLARSEAGKGSLTPADRERLIGLAFKLIPARHRLGVLDDEMRGEIIAARSVFHKHLAGARQRFVVFDRERFVAPMSIEDNLLFGRPRVDRRDAREQIDRLIRALVDEMDLRRPIVRAGLDFHVGVAGSRLSAGQRRRVALVRALMKRAPVTILDETAAGTSDDDKALRDAVRKELEGRMLLFGASNLIVANEFDHSIVMEQGRLAADRESEQ